MIDVTELLLDSDFAQTLTVTRSGGSYSPDGTYTETGTSIEVVGCLQPPSQQTAKFLPEGTRIDRTLILYTASEIKVSDGLVIGDKLTFGGRSYRCIGARDFRLTGHGHGEYYFECEQ